MAKYKANKNLGMAQTKITWLRSLIRTTFIQLTTPMLNSETSTPWTKLKNHP